MKNTKKYFEQLILILIFFITLIKCEEVIIDPNDSGTRVAGIGLGVFIIIIGFGISFIICLASGATTSPE